MVAKEIKAFFNLTLYDPLFAAEGVDIDNAEWALDELEISTTNLENIWRTSSFPNFLYCLRYPFKQHIHPISFLREFLKCERLRRKFLVLPTYKNANQLVLQYKTTVQALDSNVQKYLDAHLGIKRIETEKNLNASYYFSEGMVTFETVLEPILDMEKNVTALKEEIKFRSEVLENPNTNIDDSMLLPVIDIISERKKGPQLTDSAKFILDTEEEFNSYIGEVQEKFGPIYYNLPHFDKNPTTHTFFVYIFKMRDSESRSMHFTLADKRFFLSIEKDSYNFFEGLEDLYGPLIGKIPYWHQPATSPYTVRDIRYYADLATIVDLKRRSSLNETLVKSEKSSLLDLLLWNLVGQERSYVRMREMKARSNKKTTPFHYLISRSYPSFYYLPFNRSVWRLEEPPEFIGTRTTTEYSYKTLDEIENKLSKECLKNIMEGGRIRGMAWRKILNEKKHGEVKSNNL